MERKVVFAISAHPDDIEWRMAGTLLLLKQKGWLTHYMTIANGCCGSEILNRRQTIRVRRHEAMSAAMYLGAVFHESFANDLGVFYSEKQIKKVAAAIREVEPDVILTHPLEDYMEDHIITARLVCTAAFIRSSKGFRTDPSRLPSSRDVVVYHCVSHGLCDRIKRPMPSEFYVNIQAVDIPFRQGRLVLAQFVARLGLSIVQV